MKKFDLVHTTVLIVAILSGYAALQFLISTVAAVGFSRYLIIAVLYAVIAIVLIKNGRKYAALILKDDPGTETGDAPTPSTGTNLALELLQLTIGAFLIYAAPNLTNFIEKNIATRPGSDAQPDKKDV